MLCFYYFNIQVQLDTTKTKLEETEKEKTDLQKKYDDAVERMEREMVSRFPLTIKLF